MTTPFEKWLWELACTTYPSLKELDMGKRDYTPRKREWDDTWGRNREKPLDEILSFALATSLTRDEGRKFMVLVEETGLSKAEFLREHIRRCILGWE